MASSPFMAGEPGIPAGWSRVPGITGYCSDGQITAAYSNGRSVVLCGEPDEESTHNCDQMACGWDHVLVRLTEAEEARDGD